MKKTAIFMIMIFLFASSGCGWVGRTAGKTEAKLEHNMDVMKKEYQKGYENEKSGNGDNVI